MLAPIGVGLYQKAQIGDERQATVGGADRTFLFPVPALHRNDEQTAIGQKGCEIQRRERRFAGMLGLQIDDARGELGDVVGVERPAVVEPRIADVAAGLAGQVIHRVRQQLLDVYLDGGYAARREG